MKPITCATCGFFIGKVVIEFETESKKIYDNMNCANNNIIIIFDTYKGLCNQFHDINCGIDFCTLEHFKCCDIICLFIYMRYFKINIYF